MSQHQAVIMSIKGNYAVAYTPDRRFIKLPVKENYKIGQMIYLEKQKHNCLSAAGWQFTAAAVIAVLIIFVDGNIFSVLSASGRGLPQYGFKFKWG